LLNRGADALAERALELRPLYDRDQSVFGTLLGIVVVDRNGPYFGIFFALGAFGLVRRGRAGIGFGACDVYLFGCRARSHQLLRLSELGIDDLLELVERLGTAHGHAVDAERR